MPRPLSRMVSISSGHELDLDAVGMARDRFVHGVVEDFGRQVMQRAFVRAADIHAGPAADGLEAFQDLDVLGRIAFGGGGRAVEKVGSFAISQDRAEITRFAVKATVNGLLPMPRDQCALCFSLFLSRRGIRFRYERGRRREKGLRTHDHGCTADRRQGRCARRRRRHASSEARMLQARLDCSWRRFRIHVVQPLSDALWCMPFLGLFPTLGTVHVVAIRDHHGVAVRRQCRRAAWSCSGYTQRSVGSRALAQAPCDLSGDCRRRAGASSPGSSGRTAISVNNVLVMHDRCGIIWVYAFSRGMHAGTLFRRRIADGALTIARIVYPGTPFRCRCR